MLIKRRSQGKREVLLDQLGAAPALVAAAAGRGLYLARDDYVALGLGRIVSLCYRSSTPHQSR